MLESLTSGFAPLFTRTLERQCWALRREVKAGTLNTQLSLITLTFPIMVSTNISQNQKKNNNLTYLCFNMQSKSVKRMKWIFLLGVAFLEVSKFLLCICPEKLLCKFNSEHVLYKSIHKHFSCILHDFLIEEGLFFCFFCLHIPRDIDRSFMVRGE